MADAVAEAVVLAVVDVVVVDVVPLPLLQTDPAMGERRDLAVVHLQVGEPRGDAVRGGELVVIGVPAPARPEGAAVVVADILEDRAEATAEAIREAGGRATFMKAELPKIAPSGVPIMMA